MENSIINSQQNCPAKPNIVKFFFNILHHVQQPELIEKRSHCYDGSTSLARQNKEKEEPSRSSFFLAFHQMIVVRLESYTEFTISASQQFVYHFRLKNTIILRVKQLTDTINLQTNI